MHLLKKGVDNISSVDQYISSPGLGITSVRKNSPWEVFSSDTVTVFHAWIRACGEASVSAWIHWSAYRLVWSTTFCTSSSEINNSAKSTGCSESRAAAALIGPGLWVKGILNGFQSLSSHSSPAPETAAGWWSGALVSWLAAPRPCVWPRRLPPCCVWSLAPLVFGWHPCLESLCVHSTLCPEFNSPDSHCLLDNELVPFVLSHVSLFVFPW